MLSIGVQADEAVYLLVDSGQGKGDPLDQLGRRIYDKVAAGVFLSRAREAIGVFPAQDDSRA